MKTSGEPSWISDLNEEEIEFIKFFILSSGSIKELATIYSTSYPTLRKQLDKLIQKIRISERKENDNIIQLIQQLEKEGRIDQEIADTVVQEYGKSLNCLIVD
ncbi:DUF2089 family protein [Enterococcus malodoratus]|uniref:DUF2089 domain-containing protein n=1 Tax=Enterococcus malodoratus ATCC 43197 TaxID=1158601 RepID=R2R7S5_9ENTE|nr:DUF2089 family protein [Enterococcus malodoratus]EOH71974.1 hypothetical protein UAI_04258 [Enterococcus malodoratus ATCC 43197]EOT70002.1 hypothetical protein I585_01481 [Enterococcus malodoratus ATCC 43197]OJG64057.1 hypothetical protein RV07_GL000457 [Enterococcus malodoratus]SPW74875.1 Protein of uncharacterised function(DUF2089) [Enterococcus malodoratus]STD65213.1 Protein of uncharacterised function(DUF2089) [Enterococcus malodoratus]